MGKRKSANRGVGEKVYQRPVWITVAVWCGIVLLLGVVSNEFLSQRGFDATLKDIEVQLSTGSKPLTDLPKLIHGFPQRVEFSTNNRRYVKLHWSSLFKNYGLWVGVVDGTRFVELATVDPANDPFGAVRKDPGPQSGLPPGTKGLPQGFENVVAMPIKEASDGSARSMRFAMGAGRWNMRKSRFS